MSDIIVDYDPFRQPVCASCKHKKPGRTCDAFEIIPLEILSGKNNHANPLPEQGNDIVYEKKKD